jgi:hypothetical protein
MSATTHAGIMPTMSRSHAVPRIGIVIMLALLLAVAFWLRVSRLGALGLVHDEGTQALAVEGILRHGLPRVDSGLVYARNVFFLYVQAASAKIFGLNEFSLRFPSVLFGVVTIPVAYWLGKTLFTWHVGLLAASVLTFSGWEIEMARYARFYTAFQLMYLVSLLCFFRGFMCGERRYRLWFIGASLVTFSTHELGGVLATLFLIPLVLDSYSIRQKFAFGLWALGLAILWVLYRQLELFLRAFGAPLHRVDEVASAAGLYEVVGSLLTRLTGIGVRFYTPKLDSVPNLLQEHPAQMVALGVVAGVATAYLVYRLLRPGDARHALFAIALVWAAFFHLFGLVALMLAGYLVTVVRDARMLLTRELKVAYAVAGVCFIFWSVVAAANPELPLNRAMVEMFDYPRMYRYFFSRFVEGWPVLTLVLCVGSALLLVRSLLDRSDPVPPFLLGGIFLPIIPASLFARAHEARYFFHLYPLVVIVFARVAVQSWAGLAKHLRRGPVWSKGVLAATAAVAALFISQDANPVNAWAITARTHYSERHPVRGVTSWKAYARFHQDLKTPSLYVRARLAPQDTVVAVGQAHMISAYHFYTGRVDYAVWGGAYLRDRRVTEEGKIVGYVTGSEILDSLPGVKEVIERNSSGSTWILGDRLQFLDENSKYPEEMKGYLRTLTRHADYVGLDGQTFAMKVR